MAIVYVAENEYQADIKVFLVDNVWSADLLFYVVDTDYQANSEAKWFFENNEYRATVKIFFVDNEYAADLKVCRVQNASEARWCKGHRLIGSLGKNSSF